jgi:hypothetical protein
MMGLSLKAASEIPTKNDEIELEGYPLKLQQEND